MAMHARKGPDDPWTPPLAIFALAASAVMMVRCHMNGNSPDSIAMSDRLLEFDDEAHAFFSFLRG